MTEPEAQPVAEGARCPRCGADLAPDQEWCLTCGTAARTVLAPPPSWRLPIALLATIVVLCGAALAWALVELTENDAEVTASKIEPVTTTIAAPSAAPTPPAPTTAGAPAPDAAATTPPATTTPPDAAATAPDPAATTPPATDAPVPDAP